MKLLLNEDVPQTSYHILKEAGFNVRYLGGRNSGKTDQDIIQILYKEKRTFVSLNRNSCNHFLQDGFCFPGGMVLFDLFDFDDQFPAKMIVKMNKTMSLDFRSYYTVVKKDYINQRLCEN